MHIDTQLSYGQNNMLHILKTDGRQANSNKMIMFNLGLNQHVTVKVNLLI